MKAKKSKPVTLSQKGYAVLSVKNLREMLAYAQEQACARNDISTEQERERACVCFEGLTLLQEPDGKIQVCSYGFLKTPAQS